MRVVVAAAAAAAVVVVVVCVGEGELLNRNFQSYFGTQCAQNVEMCDSNVLRQQEFLAFGVRRYCVYCFHQ